MGGLAPNQLVRAGVGGNIPGGVDLIPADQTIASIALNAPGPGIVLLVGVAPIYSQSATPSRGLVRLQHGGTTPTSVLGTAERPE